MRGGCAEVLFRVLGVKDVFWGMGFGVKERCSSVDELSVIAQAAATPALHLVIAADPRDLRIDPCAKKSRKGELSRIEQRSIDGRGSR